MFPIQMYQINHPVQNSESICLKKEKNIDVPIVFGAGIAFFFV